MSPVYGKMSPYEIQWNQFECWNRTAPMLSLSGSESGMEWCLCWFCLLGQLSSYCQLLIKCIPLAAAAAEFT